MRVAAPAQASTHAQADSLDRRRRHGGGIGHLRGLDGLRGLAIAAVVVYHLDPSWLPGGYLGVDLFFVISGYLITALLLKEVLDKATLGLARFWARRARRLLPALGVLLVVLIPVAALVAPDALWRLRQDLLPALLFAMNWRLVLNHDSYAASLSRPPLLLHLWSLAVEEQFYLVWPLVVLALARLKSLRALPWVAALGAAGSALAMAALFRPASDPSWLYFSTGTHAEGLLVGAALAAVVPPWKLRLRVAPLAKALLSAIGAAGVAALVAGLCLLGFYSGSTYLGGMAGFDLMAGVAVVVAVHPAASLGAFLDRQPLRWMGLRSYSLYLWHWPILELTRPGADLPASQWWVQALRLGLTAAAGEASYRLVEQPWRRGQAQAALRRWARRPASRGLGLVPALALAGAALGTVLAAAAPPTLPPVLAVGATPAAQERLGAPRGWP